jgi:hypothetical protein
VPADGTEINVSVTYQIFRHSGRRLCLNACINVTARQGVSSSGLSARVYLRRR